MEEQYDPWVLKNAMKERTIKLFKQTVYDKTVFLEE